MTTLDKAILATFDKAGKHFEIYVDPDAAYAYIEKRKPDLKNILVSDEVYEDARKGEKAKPSDIQKAFGSSDIMDILGFILKNGIVQLTTDQRRKKVEERRKQIVAILLREAIDPRTNTPHTQMRLENAMEQTKFHVDPFKDPREQIDDLVKELRPLLPMKFDKVRIAVRVPAQFANKCYGTLKGYGIQREEWASNGDLMAVVEIFGGLQGEFYDKLNKMTGGNIETKIL